MYQTRFHKIHGYLHGHKAGLLEKVNEANLRSSHYEDYLDSEVAKAISVSMVLTGDAYANAIAKKPYFSGLLPDESARCRLASPLGISDMS